MPLPLIIAGVALVAGSYGVKKGIDGYKSHSEADELIEKAKARYERQRSEVAVAEKSTQKELTQLGELELQIGASFQDFSRLADALLERLNRGRQDKIEVKLPKHKLAQIQSYSFSAIGVLGSVAGAGVAGAAAGFAVYGGVMSFAAASTGTAISALSGVAASNATLAAIGGGALSAGGLGIAGGTAILGAAVAAPVLAVAGWAYANHGEEALSNARRASVEADKAVAKLIRAAQSLGRTAQYVSRVRVALAHIDASFKGYHDKLKKVAQYLEVSKELTLDGNSELEKLEDDILLSVQNGYAIAAILTDVMVTPLFKVRVVNGIAVTDAEGVPELEKDEDGSLVLDEEAIDGALATAEFKHLSIG